ncbi:MAG: hypothetical protein Q7J68_06935 [Thermoplasmata archaeon]|nr:hypothetical protein [Thermoplasmata archaeon]
MGSDAQVQAPPVEPAAPAGSSKMTLIVLAVVAIVVVGAVVGYVMFMGDDDVALTGQWTVSGGEMKIVMVMNNDTANTIYNNVTIPADPEVIDFDDTSTMPEGMVFKDLGGGDFEITSFEMMGADFGTITGSYDVNGDTMTLTMTGSGTYIDGTDYMEIDMDYTVNFAKA